MRVDDTDDEEPAAVQSVPTPTVGPERSQEQIPAPPVLVLSPERPEIFIAEIKPERRSGSSSSFVPDVYRFTPAKNRNQAVPVGVSFPVTSQVR